MRFLSSQTWNKIHQTGQGRPNLMEFIMLFSGVVEQPKPLRRKSKRQKGEAVLLCAEQREITKHFHLNHCVKITPLHRASLLYPSSKPRPQLFESLKTRLKSSRRCLRRPSRPSSRPLRLLLASSSHLPSFSKLVRPNTRADWWFPRSGGPRWLLFLRPGPSGPSFANRLIGTSSYSGIGFQESTGGFRMELVKQNGLN